MMSFMRILTIYFLGMMIYGSLNTTSAGTPRFDSSKAWDYLNAQCTFGPRDPGSERASKCRKYLVSELKKYSGKVREQPFSHFDKRSGRNYQMYNIIANFGGAGKKVILCAHWDCRPRSEYDKNPADREKPIIGANDGASGVAVLMEMARLFSVNPPPFAVEIILFDGEDFGRPGEDWDYCLGSRYFAKDVKASDYSYGVLLDMIGDSDLEIKREYNSYKFAKHIQDKVWEAAKRAGVRQFSNSINHPITDDHLQLIEAGIPCIDLIDFDYKYWHTQQDTPDKCSAESLDAVGRTLVELIYGGK